MCRYHFSEHYLYHAHFCAWLICKGSTSWCMACCCCWALASSTCHVLMSLNPKLKLRLAHICTHNTPKGHSQPHTLLQTKKSHTPCINKVTRFYTHMIKHRHMHTNTIFSVALVKESSRHPVVSTFIWNDSAESFTRIDHTAEQLYEEECYVQS